MPSAAVFGVEISPPVTSRTRVATAAQEVAARPPLPPLLLLLLPPPLPPLPPPPPLAQSSKIFHSTQIMRHPRRRQSFVPSYESTTAKDILCQSIQQPTLLTPGL